MYTCIFLSAELFLLNFCHFLSAKYFDVTNRNGIKAATVVFFHSGSVKLPKKNVMFVVPREE